MLRLIEVQPQMLAAFATAVQTDPASLNKEQDDLGSGSIVHGGGAVGWHRG